MSEPARPAPSAMEPLLPKDGRLRELAFELAQRSARLSGMLAAQTRGAVEDLLRVINCYYSNLIEGHRTTLADIEGGIGRRFSEDEEARALQHEALAHIEVQRLMKNRLATDPSLEVTGADFLCWLHGEFYARMPEEFRYVLHSDGITRAPVSAGRFRQDEVVVGRHTPPPHDALPAFMARFTAVYGCAQPGEASLLAIAAAHQRFMWIHPFADGNGRVARLLTDAMFSRTLLGHGLWSVSRGLARRQADYYAQLALADSPRQGDLDGRGNLSQKGLDGFCQFFLEVCLDQAGFMGRVLDLAGLHQRVGEYAEIRAYRSTPGLPKLRPEVRRLLQEACLRGAVPRGEAGQIMGLHVEVARKVVSGLVREGLLTAPTHRAPLALGLPAHTVPHYFPDL